MMIVDPLAESAGLTNPAWWSTLLGLLFVSSHIGLATRPLRPRLVRRFGERGFRALFSAVASATFSALVIFTALHFREGPAGPGLGASALGASLLGALVVVGFALIGGSLAVYPSSPMALFAKRVSAPRGIERISRHAFFMGVVLFAGAHALLATQLVATVFFSSLVGLAAFGSWHQDRKLTLYFGGPYRAYLAETSTLPFAAILAGRQTLVWRELPWLPMVGGAGLALLLRQVHAHVFDFGGLYVIAVVLGGAALASLGSFTRQRTKRRGGEGWTTSPRAS